MQSWYIYIGAQCITFLFLAFWAHICRTKTQPVDVPIIGKIDYKFVLFLSAIPLFLVLALQYQVGIDYKSYSEAYVEITKYGFFETVPNELSSWFGNSFVYFCKITGLFFGDNFLWYHAVLAVASIICLYIAIFKNSLLPLLSIYMYISEGYYYNLLNQARQGLAFIIILLSYKYIIEKKMASFIITIIIASFFHPSALIFLPTWFLVKIKFNLKKVFIIIIFIIILFFSEGFITQLISNTIYSGYLDTSHDLSGQTATILRALFRGALFVFVIFFRKTVIKNYPHTNILYIIFTCAMIVQVLSIRIYLLSRLIGYFYFASLLLVPYVVKSIKNITTKRYVIVGLFLYYAIAHYLFITVSLENYVRPYYQTFFGRV